MIKPGRVMKLHSCPISIVKAPLPGESLCHKHYEGERNTWVSQYIIDMVSDVKRNDFKTLLLIVKTPLHRTGDTILRLFDRMNGVFCSAPGHVIRYHSTQDLCEMRMSEKFSSPRIFCSDRGATISGRFGISTR
jgi:hypothetical protein